jgi:hypothetical protein
MQFTAGDRHNPTEYMEYLITPGIMQIIVNETSLYVQQQITAELPKLGIKDLCSK